MKQTSSITLFVQLAITCLLLMACSNQEVDAPLGVENSIPEQKNEELEDTLSNDFLEADDKLPCLSIVFIEELERHLENDELERVLSEKGFAKSDSNGGKGVIFKKKNSDEMLMIIHEVLEDGEVYFNVDYSLSYHQMGCMYDELESNNYEQDEEVYFKRGLGSYEDKYLRFRQEGFLISYQHHIGKELSVMPISDMDSLSGVEFPDTL